MEYQKQWNFLKDKFESGKLSHAYLFSGKDEEAIKYFAKNFAKVINCLGKEKPCNECQNCKMIEKVIFADLLIIKSADSPSSIKNGKDMMEISIEQIRDAQDFLSLKSYYRSYKTVIIYDAERMNLEAQDCFLKNLEEPKGNTLIMLISSKPDLLLPTIFSRCQQIKFFSNSTHDYSKEETAILQSLLKIINSNLAEKFKFAKSFNVEGENLNRVLVLLQNYFRNLMLAKIGAIEKQQYPIEQYSVSKIKSILALIENINHQLSISNVNPKLALEIVLMEI